MVHVFFLWLGSRRPETFVLKAGENISDIARYPRDMASPDKEIVFHWKEYKEPHEVIKRVAFEWPELIMTFTDSLSCQNWIEFACQKYARTRVRTPLLYIAKGSYHSMLIPLVGLKCMWGTTSPGTKHWPLRWLDPVFLRGTILLWSSLVSPPLLLS